MFSLYHRISCAYPIVVICGLTNGHIEIHGNSLEDSGVINTKSDQVNQTKIPE